LSPYHGRWIRAKWTSASIVLVTKRLGFDISSGILVRLCGLPPKVNREEERKEHVCMEEFRNKEKK
jgi:hypothetical protein